MGHCSKARQFPAVPLGQVSLGHANLFFDQIEVVEQPFPGRRNPAVRLYRLCQQIADSDQDVFILGQPRSSWSEPVLRTQLVQAASVLPCCSIWSALNSSERSGGSSPA